jgi:hypothetical protein
MSSTITALTSGGGLAMAGDTSGQLELKTNNGTTAATINTAQDVLVGGTTAIDGGVGLQVGNTSAGNAKSTLQLLGNTNSWVQFGNGLSGASRYLGWVQYNYASNYMTFATDSTERMRIDSAGNVGIGITPYVTASRTVLSVVTGSLVYQPSISNGNSSGVFNNFANIGGADKNVVTGYSQGMVFNNDGSGQVLMLTTSSTASGGSTISYTAGPYLARGGTSWTSSSDERLKNITGEIENGLDKVCSLRAAEFTWKDDESAKPCVGLIAQDVQVVLPEVITTTKKYNSEDATEYLGISYTDVIPLLVASIKELNAKVDAQALEIQALKGVA